MNSDNEDINSNSSVLSEVDVEEENGNEYDNEESEMSEVEFDADESDADESDADESDADDIDTQGIASNIVNSVESALTQATNVVTNTLNIQTEESSDDESNDDDSSDEDYDDDDEDITSQMKKFNEKIRDNVIDTYHSEFKQLNYEEVQALTTIIRNEEGDIIDPLHTTVPFLTKFEKARIIGIRSKQLAGGNEPLIKVPENVLDNYIVAEMELKAKVLPFIIHRPIPGGRREYWKLTDLEDLDY